MKAIGSLLLVIGLFSLVALGPSEKDKRCNCTDKNPILDDTSEVKTRIVYDTLHLNRATRYNPVAAQCYGNPLITADMSRIDLTKLKNGEIRWVALSRDLLSRWNGPFNYGDTILIHSEDHPFINGKWIVHDTMNKRYSKTIDFLVHVNHEGPKLGIGRDVKILTNRHEEIF